MNWKSTTALSGVTLLATWLGVTSAPPPPMAAPGTANAREERAPVEGSDIEEQARRLQVRMRTEFEYQAPHRNPFRFGARAPIDRRGVPAATIVESEPAPEPPPPEWAAYTLAGMATDSVDGRLQRTAILSTATDVLFVREGDRVGSYTVTFVDEESVELTTGDGASHRLRLTP